MPVKLSVSRVPAHPVGARCSQPAPPKTFHLKPVGRDTIRLTRVCEGAAVYYPITWGPAHFALCHTTFYTLLSGFVPARTLYRCAVQVPSWLRAQQAPCPALTCVLGSAQAEASECSQCSAVQSHRLPIYASLGQHACVLAKQGLRGISWAPNFNRGSSPQNHRGWAGAPQPSSPA